MWDRIHQIKQKMGDPKWNNPNQDEYHRAQHLMVEENLELYTEADWQQMTRLERSFFLQYIKRVSARMIRDSRRGIEFYENVTDNGKPLATEEQIGQIKKMLADAEEESLELDAMRDFAEVMPWIKKRFGEDATYLTLLQHLYPVKEVETTQQPG